MGRSATPRWGGGPSSDPTPPRFAALHTTLNVSKVPAHLSLSGHVSPRPTSALRIRSDTALKMSSTVHSLEEALSTGALEDEKPCN